MEIFSIFDYVNIALSLNIIEYSPLRFEHIWMQSFIIFSLLICCICMNAKCEISMVNRRRKTFCHSAESPFSFLLFSRCHEAKRENPYPHFSLHFSLAACNDCIKARSQGAKGQRHAHRFVIGLWWCAFRFRFGFGPTCVCVCVRRARLSCW